MGFEAVGGVHYQLAFGPVFSHHLQDLVFEAPSGPTPNTDEPHRFQGRDIILRLSQRVHRQKPVCER